MAEKISPFSNSTDFMMWKSNNCDICKKDYDVENEIVHCDIEEAISIASVSDGEIDNDIADRANLPDVNNKCKEFDRIL